MVYKIFCKLFYILLNYDKYYLVHKMNWSNTSDQLRKEQFMLEKNNIQMIEEIKDVIISSKNKIAYEVNNTILLAY